MRVRSVILTGGSRGLGASLAAELLDSGARLLILARTFPPEQRVRARAHPSELVLRPCDLSSPAELPAAGELADFLGDTPEPVLINNAATAYPLGAVGALSDAELATAATTNLAAPMMLTNSFLRAVGEPTDVGRGPLTLRPHVNLARILFVTSSTARRPKPGTAAYCATKAGGEMFFEVLRAELSAVPGVEVHTVDPGAMDTAMHAGIRGCEGAYLPDQDRLRRVAQAGGLAAPATVACRILASTFDRPSTVDEVARPR